MMDELKAFLGNLSEEDWAKFTRRYGGGDKKRTALISEIDNPHLERIACERVLEVFGKKILTAAEREEERARLVAEATLRQAEAAAEANQHSNETNRLSHEANQRSFDANEIAVRALSETRQARIWTTIAAVVAALALVVAVIALFK